MSSGAIAGIVVAVVVVVLLLAGIRIVRPTHRGLVERLGKYNRYADPGFHLIIPSSRGCSRWTSGRCWSRLSPR